VARPGSIAQRVRGAGADSVLAVCGVLLVVLSIPLLVVQRGDADAFAATVLATIAAGLCVAFARRRPTAAILGFSLALTVAVLLGSDLDADNLLLLVPYFVLPVIWAANTDRRTFVRTAPLVIVLFPLAIVLREPSSAADSISFILLIPVGLGAAGGRLLAWHAAAAERLELQARELDANRDARAAAAVVSERARIARDLHDVIAHDVSVMVVQAQAAERLALSGREGAEQAIAQVETTGRAALTETRRLLGVLRESDETLSFDGGEAST
jgi:signal transduction histidine kinase